MTYILQFIAAMSEVTRQNMAAMLAKEDMDSARILEQLDPGKLLRDYFDLAVKVIGEATGTAVEDLEELPGSTLIEVGRHVLRAHHLVLERFLAGKADLTAAAAPFKAKGNETNGHSSRPESSPPSLMPDSTTNP